MLINTAVSKGCWNYLPTSEINFSPTTNPVSTAQWSISINNYILVASLWYPPSVCRGKETLIYPDLYFCTGACGAKRNTERWRYKCEFVSARAVNWASVQCADKTPWVRFANPTWPWKGDIVKTSFRWHFIWLWTTTENKIRQAAGYLATAPCCDAEVRLSPGIHAINQSVINVSLTYSKTCFVATVKWKVFKHFQQACWSGMRKMEWNEQKHTKSETLTWSQYTTMNLVSLAHFEVHGIFIQITSTTPNKQKILTLSRSFLHKYALRNWCEASKIFWGGTNSQNIAAPSIKFGRPHWCL